MKIVSKYKDFYDYIVQDHDADIIYVRNIGLVNKYIRINDDTITGNYSYNGYISSYYKKYNGLLEFSNFIFGIFPYIYSQPILRIYGKYLASGTIESTYIILSKNIVDRLLSNDDKVSKEAYNDLLKLAQKEFDKNVDNRWYDNCNVDFHKNNKFSDIQKSLKTCVWKVEYPNMFYEIKSPVFVKYYDELFCNGSYWENWPKKPVIGNESHIYYVTDISFQKLNDNILKYWYNDVFDLNTYINIENFLWSVKQEPEAKPDNKTKILAHGFDLKTSFRKM